MEAVDLRAICIRGIVKSVDGSFRGRFICQLRNDMRQFCTVDGGR